MTTREKIDELIDSIYEYTDIDGYREQPSELIDMELSGRGGGLKVNVGNILHFKNNEDDIDTTCGTYQNYLGGGMLGAVCFGSNFQESDLYKSDLKNYEYLKEELQKLHFNLTNHEDEWEHQEYEQNQAMPVSAY